MMNISSVEKFALPLRILHWLMAVVIMAMLVIGVLMATNCTPYYAALLAWHRPLGILILFLAAVRLLIRLQTKSPALPADLPQAQKLAAKASHVALYGLMFLMPLLGWSMLSAGGYPIHLWAGFDLPPILGNHDHLWHVLRTWHSWVAFALFAVILLHVTAALYHKFIRRDHVLDEML